MRTNLEKWNHYLQIINEKEKEFINDNIIDIPKYIYEVYPSGKIRTLNVVNLYYRNNIYCGGKPTRNDVSKIKEYAEDMPSLTVENVSFGWECIEHGYKSSSAIRYTELHDKFFTNKEKAELKANELLEAKNKEEELLKNGHVKCAYCGKVVPEKESVSHQIIFQNSRPDPFSKTGYKKFVDKKTNKYCSGKCGGNDQMAHEG